MHLLVALTLRVSSPPSLCKLAPSLLIRKGSHILTRDHDLHRQRRKPMEPFFSRAGVQRLHNMLHEVTLKLESRLRDLEGSHRVIRLDHAFSAFSSDVMCRL